MYFFDTADYIGTCFFGPNSLMGGDPEDSMTTYRATRDAWLKAINEYYLSFTACATCSSTIIGIVDVEFSKIDKMSNLNTVEYSLARIDSYASWIVKLIAYLNKQCCITDLTSRLLLGKNDSYLMEEFSNEEQSLSFQFLNSYFKALSNDR